LAAMNQGVPHWKRGTRFGPRRSHQFCESMPLSVRTRVGKHYGPRALAASAITRKVPGKFHDESCPPVSPDGSAGERLFEIGRRVGHRLAASPVRVQIEFEFTVSERRPRISHQVQIESFALAAMNQGVPHWKRGTRFGPRRSHQFCESMPLSVRARVGKGGTIFLSRA
jgi:hypothetical protein